ncbi:MAG: hypothetical protein PHR35_03480 [Kiritimatiellae bacterium]|nr:hypothetical protein [Kiritimatiellia bacterium]
MTVCRRGMLVACCCAGLWLTPSAWAVETLTDWDDFDAAVSAFYDDLGTSAPCYPPTPCGFLLAEPPRPFDPDGFPGLTNDTPPVLLLDFPAWRLRVVETQLTERVWLTFAGTNTVHTNAVPVGFDPEQWVRDAYGDPPTWLYGEELAEWYAERYRHRIAAQFTLIPTDTFVAYQAALAAAATNQTPSPTGPFLPADTNRVAFAGIAVPDAQTVSLDLYSPSTLPVDIFWTGALPVASLWEYAGTVQAVHPFTPAIVPQYAAQVFLHCARGDIDTDGDGLADGLEMLALGTHPGLYDSDGDGVADRAEIYRYGLAPLLRDTDADGMDDDEELLAGTNPTQWNTGGGSSTIRYYYDSDDRLTATYAGSGGGAIASPPTPAGNLATLHERSQP